MAGNGRQGKLAADTEQHLQDGLAAIVLTAPLSVD